MTKLDNLMAQLTFARGMYDTSMADIAKTAVGPDWPKELGYRHEFIEPALASAKEWAEKIEKHRKSVMKERRRLFREEHGLGPREKIDPVLLAVKFPDPF